MLFGSIFLFDAIDLDIIDPYFLISVSLLPVAWLWLLADNLLALKVTRHSEWFSMPNSFGFLLVIIGSLLSLAVYYLIACIISKYYYQKKARKI